MSELNGQDDKGLLPYQQRWKDVLQRLCDRELVRQEEKLVRELSLLRRAMKENNGYGLSQERQQKCIAEKEWKLNQARAENLQRVRRDSLRLKETVVLDYSAVEQELERRKGQSDE